MFYLFKHCYFKVCQAMAWQIEVGSCSLTINLIDNVSTMVWQPKLQLSPYLSNVPFLAIIFVTFNKIDTIVCFTWYLFVYCPCFFFIYFNLVSSFNVWAGCTILSSTFSHTSDNPAVMMFLWKVNFLFS